MSNNRDLVALGEYAILEDAPVPKEEDVLSTEGMDGVEFRRGRVVSIGNSQVLKRGDIVFYPWRVSRKLTFARKDLIVVPLDEIVGAEVLQCDQSKTPASR